MVMEGVEVDVELVRLDIVVPAGQDCLDSSRLAIVEPSSDVERIGADQHSHLGVLGGRLAFDRIGLGEPRRRLGAGPRRLIQMPVYLDATLQLGSTDLPGVGVGAAGTKRVARLGGHGVLQGSKHYRSKRDGNSAEHTTPRLMAS